MNINSSIYKTDENHVYYNVQLTGTTNRVQPLRFKETRTAPLLSGPARDYSLAIVRFQVPLSSIPIMFFPKQYATVQLAEKDGNPGTGIPDNNIWSITLESAGEVRQRFVEFIHYNANPNPLAPNDLSIFSIQHFLDLINDAFYRASIAFTIPIDPPFMVHNITEGHIDLYAPEATYNLASGRTVWMNRALYNLFQDYTIFYDNRGTIGRIYRIIVKEDGDNFKTTVRPPQLLDGTSLGPIAGCLIARGEMNSLGLLFSPRSIVFASSLLPIRPESLPASNVNRGGNSSNAQSNILTDFELDIEGNLAKNVRTIQTFNNAGEYRLTDLLGDGHIKTIDIDVYWKDNLGRLTPLLISNNGYFSMKILFRKNSYKSFL